MPAPDATPAGPPRIVLGDFYPNAGRLDMLWIDERGSYAWSLTGPRALNYLERMRAIAPADEDLAQLDAVIAQLRESTT